MRSGSERHLLFLCFLAPYLSRSLLFSWRVLLDQLEEQRHILSKADLEASTSTLSRTYKTVLTGASAFVWVHIVLQDHKLLKVGD